MATPNSLAGSTADSVGAQRQASSAPPESTRAGWTFLTNHAHVLIAISRDPELRQRDIGQLVGITEGAVQRILHELEDAGFLHRERVGRRNRYQVDADRPLRHPLERDHTMAEILRSINDSVDS
jgi:DNA-binding transcriptional ArsR family regulator